MWATQGVRHATTTMSRPRRSRTPGHRRVERDGSLSAYKFALSIYAPMDRKPTAAAAAAAAA